MTELVNQCIILEQITVDRNGTVDGRPFDSSGIFASGNPEKRAAAIVQAVTNYNDPAKLAELSYDLGRAMVGINAEEIKTIMAERGQ